jgi:hypothetical protein
MQFETAVERQLEELFCGIAGVEPVSSGELSCEDALVKVNAGALAGYLA